MKRITAILLTASALLGCSYVGNVGATELCDNLTDLTVTIAEARDAGVTQSETNLMIASKMRGAELRQAARNITTIVYLRPEASGAVIGESVRQLCENGSKK